MAEDHPDRKTDAENGISAASSAVLGEVGQGPQINWHDVSDSFSAQILPGPHRPEGVRSLDWYATVQQQFANDLGIALDDFKAGLKKHEQAQRGQYDEALKALDWSVVASEVRQRLRDPSELYQVPAVADAIAKRFGIRADDLIQGHRNYHSKALANSPKKSEIEYVVSSEDITYMPAVLAACFLPHVNVAPQRLDWEVHHMNNSLFVDANKLIDPKNQGQRRQCHVPWGGYGRLLFAHMHQEGMKTNQVNMGGSMRGFMSQHGVPIGGKHGKCLQENAENIGAADISIATWTDGHAKSKTIKICDEHEFWLEKDGRQCVIWEPTFKLSDEYVKMIRERPVPVFFPHLIELRKYPFAWDLYLFLNWRLPQIKAPIVKIPHESMISIFWHHNAGGIDLDSKDPFKAYRKTLTRQLKRVLELYPDARVEIERDHMVLRRSKPVIPKKTAARQQYAPKLGATKETA